MSTVALAFMVYAVTGSVLHMGGIMAVSTVPMVVTAWIGGAFLDRYSARNVMVLADASRAALIFAMPFLAQQAVGLVYIVAALMGVFSALFNPAQIKLVGEVVTREDLVKTNSYLGISRDGAELIGFLVGGVLVTYLGYTIAFAIDAASYAVSGVLLIGLPAGLKHAGSTPRVRALVAESPAVLGRLWRHPALRANLLLAVFGVAAAMMYAPNSYGLALEVFNKGAAGLATLEVFVAAGLILGGLLYSRTRLTGDKNGHVFFSLLAWSVLLVTVSFSEQFWVSIVLVGLVGLASVGALIPSITLVQEVPASPYKGRLIAIRSGFGQLGITAGFLLGGFLGAEAGIMRTFLLAGVATAVISIAIYVPYRLAASRRARGAWRTATEAGARRSEARQVANDAAFNGNAAIPGETSATAWAKAAEAAAMKER
jgi:MFS family permease